MRNLTITKIAYTCGFSAPHYFNKSFKAKLGV
ncbi:AraC family transcriptional regulator [Labilibacter sediminis]|nr:AraC family transcriptional regulator [Labilibacter sediminis]